MTDQVFSMGQNEIKGSGYQKEKLVPTLVLILKGFEIVQIASGEEMTIFLTSEEDVLEIGKYNQRGKPFLRHKFPEPIVNIVTGYYSFYALSSLGNMFSLRNNQFNQLGFPGGREWNVPSPRMISFFSKKGLKVEEVVGSHHNNYFLCEGGVLFGAGIAKDGRLGNPELETNPDTPILIDTDVERVFTGPAANHVFTKLDESVWSFGVNHNNQRGFVGNEPNDWRIRLHKDLASNEIVKIVCGTYSTIILKEEGSMELDEVVSFVDLMESPSILFPDLEMILFSLTLR